MRASVLPEATFTRLGSPFVGLAISGCPYEGRSAMRRLTILGILACAVLLAVPASVNAAQPPIIQGNVTVVSPIPLPVTGNVNATVPGTVNATVSNTPSNPLSVIVLGSPAAYRFIGYATIDFKDDDGLSYLNASCQSALNNPLARMCTTEEYLRSPNAIPPTAAQKNAFMQPTHISFSFAPFSQVLGGNEDTFVCVESPTGIVTQIGLSQSQPPLEYTSPCQTQFTCNQWRLNGGEGIVITPKGNFDTKSCEAEPVSTSVSCCAP